MYGVSVWAAPGVIQKRAKGTIGEFVCWLEREPRGNQAGKRRIRCILMQPYQCRDGLSGEAGGRSSRVLTGCTVLYLLRRTVLSLLSPSGCENLASGASVLYCGCQCGASFVLCLARKPAKLYPA